MSSFLYGTQGVVHRSFHQAHFILATAQYHTLSMHAAGAMRLWRLAGVGKRDLFVCNIGLTELFPLCLLCMHAHCHSSVLRCL